MNLNILETKFLGKTLKNPVSVSSGCFGYGLDYTDYFDPNILGTFALKGMTLADKQGNDGIRIAETSSGILNSVGLQNPGIDYFEKHTLKAIQKKVTVPLTANINGSTVEDYIELTKRFNEIEEVAFLEINVSCPNVKDGGMAFGANPKMVRKVTSEIKKVAKKPFLVKLSPNVTDIVEIAKIVEEEGADGISLINTLLGMAIDVNTRKPVLGNVFGGLSGRAVKPVALRMVYQVSCAVDIPILGMGGIACANDALEFMMAGASVVSVGTHLFENPLIVEEIIAGLETYALENKLQNISEIIGTAHADGGKRYQKLLKEKI